MSTIIYQKASQPSMDVVEATTMRLKLVSPKSYLFQSLKPIQDFDTDHTSYDHLLHQSLKLSQKSLELCTESLGSETGSNSTEDVNAIFACPPSTSSSVTKGRKQVETKRVLSRSFPPPLTTMSGSKPFQVKPHREGGRLIIEATETSLGSSYLRAERSHGRLRLTWSKSREENEVGKSEEEMERNVVVENFQRIRRCNEDENGDKGICSNWEPCCWVATS